MIENVKSSGEDIKNMTNKELEKAILALIYSLYNQKRK